MESVVRKWLWKGVVRRCFELNLHFNRALTTVASVQNWSRIKISLQLITLFVMGCVFVGHAACKAVATGFATGGAVGGVWGTGTGFKPVGGGVVGGGVVGPQTGYIPLGGFLPFFFGRK